MYNVYKMYNVQCTASQYTKCKQAPYTRCVFQAKSGPEKNHARNGTMGRVRLQLTLTQSLCVYFATATCVSVCRHCGSLLFVQPGNAWLENLVGNSE